jgi:hypothetical protein
MKVKEWYMEEEQLWDDMSRMEYEAWCWEVELKTQELRNSRNKLSYKEMGEMK